MEGLVAGIISELDLQRRKENNPKTELHDSYLG